MDERRRTNRKAIFQEMLELTNGDIRAAAILTAGEMLFENLYELTGIIGQGVHIGLFGRDGDDRDLTLQDVASRRPMRE